jgi:hypothetical protein
LRRAGETALKCDAQTGSAVSLPDAVVPHAASAEPRAQQVRVGKRFNCQGRGGLVKALESPRLLH